MSAPSRSTWLRAAAVVAITGTITLAAACSEDDVVDTVPPPWPTRTVTPDGPPVPRTPEPAPTTTTVPVPARTGT